MNRRDWACQAHEAMHDVARAGKGSRLLVTGGVGTGRTVLVALLAHLFAMQGMEVLAVDADPEQHLAASLGFPLARLYEGGVEEQHANGTGTLLHLGPQVSGPHECCEMRLADRLTLCITGDLDGTGYGRFGEMTREFLRLTEGVVLLDTLAGAEHLYQATAEGFSRALVMADSSQGALSVALRAAAFVHTRGIDEIHLVVNQVCGETDLEEVGRAIGPCHLFTTITYLPYDEGVGRAWPAVFPLLQEETPFMNGVRGIFRILSRTDRR
ncbi:CO dehydrogenase maturation factor [Methanofollis sp. W23]|uniref:nucleotide-binding protein n=1 Tax=Methanofollis sp. W23 TaxID=2817849 RepID=UPI001AE1B565|nr:carbon monoxide dehydrogenase [Methanofollis sp. W23]MBP2146085.1 CO dehydrogenase maturation factor [Methanofollis sp. W23]